MLRTPDIKLRCGRLAIPWPANTPLMSTTPTSSIGDQAGWFFQMPSESSSPVPKIPAAAAVVTA